MWLSMLMLGWACYYMPPGVSCCPPSPLRGQPWSPLIHFQESWPVLSGRLSGKDVVALFTRLSARLWGGGLRGSLGKNGGRDPADGAFLCGQTRSRVQRGAAMGQAGVAGRLLHELERIRLTAVAFLQHPASDPSDRRWHQNAWDNWRRVIISFITSF